MEKQTLQKFLEELTDLSRKHGLAINPDGDLFEMEPEDYQRSYTCADDSHLDFV